MNITRQPVQTPSSLWRRRNGFSMVEGIVAVMLLALISVFATRLFLANTRVVVSRTQFLKAHRLSDMVLEQFNNIATTHFTKLITDYGTAHPVTVGEFFGTGSDDLGFTGYSIEPLARQGDGGSVILDLTLRWNQDGKDKTLQMTKTLYPNSPAVTGGTVDVYVVENCGSSNPGDCAGLNGFEVTAAAADSAYRNQFGKNEIWAQTVNGRAILRGVLISQDTRPIANQPIVIKVSKAGSPFNTVTQRLMPYSPGYYRLNRGVSVTTGTVSIIVSRAGPNIAEFRDFLPLGFVDGSIVMTDGASPGGMEVWLSSGLAVEAGTLNPRASNVSPYMVVTDTAGYFAFCNVAPGPITVAARGRRGSNPIVQVTDPGFALGYFSTAPSQRGSLVAAGNATDPAPTLNLTGFRLSPFGGISVTTLTKGSRVPLPNTWVRVPTTENPWQAASYIDVKTDSTGRMSFNNVIGVAAPNPQVIHAFRSPTSLTDPGWHSYNNRISLMSSVNNAITMELDQMNRITGQMVDLGNAPVPGLTVTILAHGLPSRYSYLTFTTNTEGYFGNAGYSGPITNLVPDILTTNNLGFIPRLPWSVNDLVYDITWLSHPLKSRFHGHMLDSASNQPVTGALLTVTSGRIENPITHTPIVMTDTDGAFDAYVIGNLHLTVPVPHITCYDDSVPAGVPLGRRRTCLQTLNDLPDGVPVPTRIDPTRAYTSLSATKGCYTRQWSAIGVEIKDGVDFANIDNTLFLALTTQRVSGTVREVGTGAPIKNIQVCDQNAQKSCTTTAADGTYSLDAIVKGRASVPSNPGVWTTGKVNMQIVATATGPTGLINGSLYKFEGTQGPSPLLPEPPDCTTPIIINLETRKIIRGL